MLKANELGPAKIPSFDSRHTFSLGQYCDPEHMGFRVLRVIDLMTFETRACAKSPARSQSEIRADAASLRESAPSTSGNQRNDEQDDEDYKQDFRDGGGQAGDAEEAEETSDQRDDQEDYGVVKHGVLLVQRGGHSSHVVRDRSYAATADLGRPFVVAESGRV